MAVRFAILVSSKYASPRGSVFQVLPGGTERENQKTNPETRRTVPGFSGIHDSHITYFTYAFPAILCHKGWISYQSLCRHGAHAFYRFQQVKAGKIAQEYSRKTTRAHMPVY